MFKLILLGIVSFLSVLSVAAQSPKELLLEIQKSKPDTNRISLQLKLGSYYLFKPGEFKNDLDSAIKFFTQAAQLSNKLREVDWQYRTLALTGNYFIKAGDLERCKQCFMRVIAYYHKIGNMGKEADAWYQLGDLFNNNGKNDHQADRISFYQHARSLYLQNHQQENAATMLKNIADIQIGDKQFDMAENELQQVLAQYKALGYKKLQYTYNLLYTLEYSRGHYYRAMAYGSEGIRSMKASGDTALLGYFYCAMARCNSALKKTKEALEWMRKATVADKGYLEYNYYLIQNLIALNRIEEARVALNDLASKKPRLTFGDTINQYRTFALYYNKINKSNLAVGYYMKILDLDLRKHLSEEFYTAWCLICNVEIAGIYLKANQAEKAEKYLDTATRIIKNIKTPLEPRYLVTFYYHLYKYDLAIGKYQAAVKNLEQHDRIQDSLFTADNDKQVAELDIQYQTAQKEQSITFLHSQSAVQQTRFEKVNMQRNITIGGVVLLLIIAGITYNGYRHKQRSNLQLQAKQQQINNQNKVLQNLLTEKEWLLKEVHHRVKNNLHTVICLLESQARHLENDALKAIENSQHRIYAMSLIHQTLYQSDDIKTINMSDYTTELALYLQEAFDVSDRIKFKLKVDPINLSPSYAIPLGLIINEAVTNSIKYAFPNKRKGAISISLVNEGNKIKLELADNGVGMPLTDNDIDRESMGLRLIKGLSEDIRADININVDHGTMVTIVFNPGELNDPDGYLKSLENKEIFA